MIDEPQYRNGFIPLIALRMATSVPEIDDLSDVCKIGSWIERNNYLSSLLAKH
jgi:hypothetical protein